MNRSLPRHPGLKRATVLVALLMLVLVNGCGRIAGHYTKPLLDDLTRSFMMQKDVVLAEQGTPAFLLIIDGLIVHSPENKTLLLSGAQAYQAYAAAFVGAKNPERNKILAAKAKDYAMRAMVLHNKRFAEVVDSPHNEFVTCVPTFKKEDVPFVFYLASSWVGWIQANSDSWDAIADLPKVQSLIERVLELDEGFYYGAAHTFMGALQTIRPPSLGGLPEEARKHFERAIELGEGKFLPTYIMFAKQYAKLVYEEDLFYELLNKVLETPADTVPELTLINILAQDQARTLIEEAREDEYFD